FSRKLADRLFMVFFEQFHDVRCGVRLASSPAERLSGNEQTSLQKVTSSDLCERAARAIEDSVKICFVYVSCAAFAVDRFDAQPQVCMK
ncbi:MAG: hypothetical protein AAGA05_11890, partial [Pseudomonadota bacterium]